MNAGKKDCSGQHDGLRCFSVAADTPKNLLSIKKIKK
mgnify:FL=1|jgi:hypothetical protein